jgi:hypothetical protein
MSFMSNNAANVANTVNEPKGIYTHDLDMQTVEQQYPGAGKLVKCPKISLTGYDKLEGVEQEHLALVKAFFEVLKAYDAQKRAEQVEAAAKDENPKTFSFATSPETKAVGIATHVFLHAGQEYCKRVNQTKFAVNGLGDASMQQRLLFDTVFSSDAINKARGSFL